MNKMKIEILFRITVLSTAFGGEVQQSNFYLNVEGGYPNLANLSFGHRSQKDHNGFDVGIGIAPIFYFMNAYGYANYIYYLNPNPCSQYYIGVGSSLGNGCCSPKVFTNIGWFFKPQLLIGKEFQINRREKHFIQFSAGNYFKLSGENDFNPSLTLRYGFKY